MQCQVVYIPDVVQPTRVFNRWKPPLLRLLKRICTQSKQSNTCSTTNLYKSMSRNPFHFHLKELCIQIHTEGWILAVLICWYVLKVAMRLTYNTDLPDFDKGILDVLDVRQTLVQVRLEEFIALWVAFCNGSEDPATSQDRHRWFD